MRMTHRSTASGMPPLGTKPATRECGPTWKGTNNPLVLQMMPNQLKHSGQFVRAFDAVCQDLELNDQMYFLLYHREPVL